LLYIGHACLAFGILVTSVAVYQAKPFFDPTRQIQGLVTWAIVGLFITSMLFLAWIGMMLMGYIALSLSLFLLAVEFYYAPVPEKSMDMSKEDFFMKTGQQPTGAAPGADTRQVAPVQAESLHRPVEEKPPDSGEVQWR
jgi:hypothetical protein